MKRILEGESAFGGSHPQNSDSFLFDLDMHSTVGASDTKSNKLPKSPGYFLKCFNRLKED